LFSRCVFGCVGGKYFVCVGGADTDENKKISAKTTKRAQAKKIKGKKKKKRHTQRGCLKRGEINSL